MQKLFLDNVSILVLKYYNVGHFYAGSGAVSPEGDAIVDVIKTESSLQPAMMVSTTLEAGQRARRVIPQRAPLLRRVMPARISLHQV